MENNKSLSKSVQLSVEILKCLSGSVTRLSDISSTLGIGISTVHRTIKTLEYTGMVSQDPTNKHYHLGKLFVDLASPIILSHQRVRDAGIAEMERLRDLSGETVIIYMRLGNQIFPLVEVQSKDMVKVTITKHEAIPLNVGSASRVLLAELTDREVERIIKNVAFVAYTPNTILDKNEFLQSVQETREKGYALSRSTYNQGTAGVTVPIKNYVIPITLSVLGPEERLWNKIHGLISEMKESAERISNNLQEM